MLEAIDNLISKTEGICTTKESEFLYSIRRQFVRKGELSFGQRNWFTSIEAKYSQEELQAEEAWRQAFGEEQRQEAIRVADYYAKNPPYYSQYIERVHQNPDSFILSRKEWARFCENKYAWKVRQSYKEDLKYDQGSLVQIRKSNRLDLANYNTMSKLAAKTLGDKVAVVLKQDALPVTRAAKGSRVYQILVVGETSPIMAHESDLKTRRGANSGKKN